MGTCGSCFGQGKVTCSGCGGRRHVTRYGAGGVETTSCAVCYGRGRMRCDFCGGTGNVHTGAEPVHENPREIVRDGFEKILKNSRSPAVLPTLLAAHCLGSQQRFGFDLDLPADKAQRLMQAQGDDFQPAYRDFVEALELGGWIS